MSFDYKPGDIIQDYSEPLVKVLNENYKGTLCDYCFQPKHNLQRCSRCQIMYYCDQSCQTKDWKQAHSFECKSDYFKKPNLSKEFNYQMCRLFSLLELHPKQGTKQYQMYDGTTRSFNDLMSHASVLKNDPRVLIFCINMAKNLYQEGIPDMNNQTGINYLVRLAGIWKTNAFTILNEYETASIGSGIFIEPSVFDHSCKPTALFNLDGCRMQIRSIGLIPKGIKPCVSYIAGHKNKQERWIILKERYNFECHCERCEEEKQSGDAVNYNKLQGHIQKASSTMNWKNYIQLHEQILTMMRELYHEYDERITYRCFLTLEKAVGLKAPKEIIKKLWTSAEEHIRITFGTENQDYTKLGQLTG